MNRKRILLNLLIVSILVFSLYSLNMYGVQARNFVYGFLGDSQKAVAGASTVSVSEVSLPAFTQKLQSDLLFQVGEAKNFGLHLSMGEIIKTVSRVKKVSDDARGVREAVKEKLSELAGK